MTNLTFELRVGDAAPLSTAIAHTCTAHHVTKNIMASVPLITHTIHHTLTSGTHLFMGWWKPINKHFSKLPKSFCTNLQIFKFSLTVLQKKMNQTSRLFSQWDKRI